MKHNYKIKLKEPDLTDEQVYAHKDFDKVFKRYKSVVDPLHRKPLYKNPKTFLGVVLFTVIGILVYYAMMEEETVQKQEEVHLAKAHKMKEAREMTPLPGTAPEPWITYNLPEGQEKKFDLPGGLSLSIPKDALVDAKGNPVSEVSTIDVRFFSDPQTMAIQGLNLETQPGSDKVLNSLNAFEIRILQGDEELQIREGSSLKLDLAGENSNQSLQECNLYGLNRVTTTWEPIKGKIQVLAPGSTEDIKKPEGDGFGMIEEGKARSKKKPKTQIKEKDSQSFLRSFSVEKLGVFNLGKEIDRGSWDEVALRFEDAEGNEVHFFGMYLMNREMNTVQYLWPKDDNFTFNVKLNPDQDQLLAGITPDGRLAVMRAESFKKIDAGSKEVQTVRLEIIEAEISSIEDLKRVLSFQSVS